MLPRLAERLAHHRAWCYRLPADRLRSEQLESAYGPVMSSLESWTRGSYTAEGVTHPTYRKGSGPGVIVIHEIPGITPAVLEFAEDVVARGFTVVMPSLFGRPGVEATVLETVRSIAGVCVSRELTLFALGRTTPVATWLQALSRELHRELGGPGVGAVGMCFTGGYALAMMTEPSVVAPVLSQPSVPFLGKDRWDKTDASLAEIKCAKDRMEKEDLSMIGLRFKGDPVVPGSRFAFYKKTFGDRFEGIELEDKDAAPGGNGPHSVLTINLKDSPGEPTKLAEERVIQFFKQRTGA